MDDYSDLVTASLALLCAGIMLVAGQLTIEHSATNAPRKGVEMPPRSGASPAMISRAPSSEEKAPELRREPEKKRHG
jgi:hypothetical protein